MQAPLNRQQDPATVIATKSSILFMHEVWNLFFNQIEDGEIWTDNDFVAFASNKISIHTRDHFTRCLTDCKCCLRHQTKRPTYKQYQSGHSGLFPLSEDVDGDITDEESLWSDDWVNDDGDDCDCHCRQYTRLLCRMKCIECPKQ